MSRVARALAVAIVLVMGAASAFAAEEKVQLGEASGTFMKPEGKGPFPAVVVIPEWWGLNEQVLGQARKLQAEGYAVYAVDIYRGKVTKDKDEAHQLMSGLSQDQALSDLKTALEYLRSRPDIKSDKVGALGWCMGGRYALLLATEDPKLAAVVAYYGAPPTDAAAVARMKAPVLGNFGGDDKGPSPEAVKAFEAAAKKAGLPVDVKIYPGAGHAFANETNPFGGYKADAAADAWTRTTTFFKKHLKGQAP
jgi:carboxymethylenebutenolidase